MGDQYWVGSLPTVGDIVYDPAIQDDEAEFVLLFVVKSARLQSFNRSKTRGNIAKAESKGQEAISTRKYDEWRERISNKDDTSKEPAGIGLSDTATTRQTKSESMRMEKIIDSMQAMLQSRDNEIERLRTELDTLSQNSKIQAQVLHNSQSEASKLQEKVEQINSVEALDDLSRQAAFYASGGDETFRSLILPLKLDANLPIQIAAHLENRLRQRLDESDPSLSLFELIMCAKDTKIMNEQCTEMAHIIRKQRNVIAHAKYSRAEATARIMLALYAAALWPRMPV